MEKQRIKIRSPRDLFSILPYALGYEPEESILVVCLRDQGGLGMIARTSLSDLPNSKCCRDLSKMVSQSAIDDNTKRAFVVIYCAATDEFTLHGYKKQAKYFADALKPIPIETWVINSEIYYRVDCDEHGRCPQAGFPVSELVNTEPSTALVFRGYAPARSREEYLRLPQPPASQANAAHQAERRFNAEKRRSHPVASWRAKAFATWKNALQLAAQGHTIPPQVLGVLGAALMDTSMRDAVLLSCLPDGGVAASEIIEKSDAVHQTAAELLARAVGSEAEGTKPLVPEAMVVRQASTVLEAVVAYASEQGKPAPLTLLGFLAWWAGDGTRANARVRQALTITPHYQLAITLAGAIECHLLPGWIRNRAPVTAAEQLGVAA